MRLLLSLLCVEVQAVAVSQMEKARSAIHTQGKFLSFPHRPGV